MALLLLPLVDGVALTNKVLIIGVDGTMPQYLLQAQTPNLDALCADGCYSHRAITHPVTHSAACWTAMFTGVWGDKNGVNDLNNGFNGTHFDRYPNFMKRLETVNSSWNTVAYLRWSPLSTALSGTDVIQSFGSDGGLTTATCQHLTNANPDVFYTILLDVDSAGHNPGWGTTTYVQAIETADARVGQMMNALTNRLTYANENWLVIVLSDHGEHDHPDIGRSRVTFHIVSGPAAARGVMRPSPSMVDVCATVLTHMGVAVDPAWNLDARLEGLPLPVAGYETNLIYNGGAEANSGTNNYYILDDNQKIDRGAAWWFDGSMVTLGQYGARASFPGLGSPGPTHRGNSFFLGGLGMSNVISQVIDVSHLAADIDDLGVDYTLAGFLGGVLTNDGIFTFSARFLNAASTGLGTNSIGPVTATDRTNTTCLLERSVVGQVPLGTRLIEFVLAAVSTAPTNDAAADNLSFELTPRAAPPFVVSMHRPNGLQNHMEFVSRMNRLYHLERSEDLRSWTKVSDEVAGTGSVLRLVDTNPPSGQGYYRVNCRLP